MGAMGGFVGPYLIGEIKQRTGEFGPGLVFLAGCMTASAMIVLGMRRRASS
jgi:nitrate/nitrite transporter NarK